MKRQYPIGVFDSGLGGLSVVKTIKQLLPSESIYYYGDSLNAPYGEKLALDVLQRSEHVVQKLLKKPVKAIVIACNTATSAAAEHLRKAYPNTIIIGMEPAIKPALVKVKSAKICVLATAMTLRESKFNALINQLNAAERIVKCPAPQLVEYVESGANDSVLLRQILDEIVTVDKTHFGAVVLGCTHYLFVKDAIQDYFGSDIPIYDGNVGTVIHLKNELIKHNLLAQSSAKASLTIENSAGQKIVDKSYQLLR